MNIISSLAVPFPTKLYFHFQILLYLFSFACLASLFFWSPIEGKYIMSNLTTYFFFLFQKVFFVFSSVWMNVLMWNFLADDIDEEKDAASHLIVWQLLARYVSSLNIFTFFKLKYFVNIYFLICIFQKSSLRVSLYKLMEKPFFHLYDDVL